MSIEAIIENVAQFVLYIGIFYIVLIWLKVSEKRILRSLLLATILSLAELVSSPVAGLLLTNFGNAGIMGVVLSAVLLVLIFYLIVKNFLKLKTWQYIVIPVGVSIVGNVVLASIVMFYFKMLTRI